MKRFMVQSLVLVVLLHIAALATLFEYRYISRLIRADIYCEDYNRAEDVENGDDGEYKQSEWLHQIHLDCEIYFI